MRKQATKIFKRLALLMGIIVSAVGVCGIVAPPTFAEDGSNPTNTTPTQITLSPAKQRIDLQKGQTYNGSFTVYNSGQKDFSFTVYAAPYTVKSDADYTPVFTKDVPRTQMSRWVKFDKKEFQIKAGDSVQVSYSIVVPASIPEGSQYAALFAETTEQATGSVVTKKRVGMLLYAKPDGTTIDKGTAEFGSIKKLQFGRQFTSVTKLSNDGNTDFDATVTLKRTPVFGGTEKTSEQVRTVLPDSTRTVTMTQQTTSLFAIYDVTESAKIFDKTTTKTTRVIVISPLIAIGAAILLLVGIAFMSKGFWHASSHKKTNKSHTHRK